MKKLILISILLLLMPTVLGYGLEEYPEFFFNDGNFNAKIVVGERAPTMDITSTVDLIPGLQSQTTSRIRGSTLDKDISDINDHNIISIGNACDNTVTAEILGADNCDSYFKSGEAYIYLYEYNGKTWLVIGGGTPEDTAKATKVLGRYEDYALLGSAFKVTGSVHPFTIEPIVLPRGGRENAEVEIEEVVEKKEEVVENYVPDIEEEEDVRNEYLAEKIDELVEEEKIPESKPYVEDESYKEAVPKEAPIYEQAWIVFKNWLRWFFK